MLVYPSAAWHPVPYGVHFDIGTDGRHDEQHPDENTPLLEGDRTACFGRVLPCANGIRPGAEYVSC